MNMENSDGNEIAEKDQTVEFLTASELVSLRKSDEESARCVIGEKFYIRSDTWLENKAIECAVENQKCTLNQKRGARICDLMQAEWSEELNASITSKLKGKFVQHMGHASNGKIALSPEESIFLLENGTIEILNDKIPMSTEEAYKAMLKGNLSAEKYQVYSHLSQLGFIVVPHQTELGVTKYEKKINLDQHQIKKKRKILSSECEEPDRKRLTFLGAFSSKYKPNARDNSKSQDVPSSSVVATGSSIEQNEEFVANHPDKSSSASSHSKLGEETKESLPSESHAILVNQEQNKEEIENFSSDTVDFAPNINETEEITNVTSSTMITTTKLPNSSKETEHQTQALDTLNEINAPNFCNNFSENSKRIEVELQTVEVGPSDETCFQQENGNSQSCDTTYNCVPENDVHEAVSSLSKNDIDVMDIDSQNTEISCTSEVSQKVVNASNSNITAASQDSCAVINGTDNAVDLGEARDSNSDVMSCSSQSEGGNFISVNAPSEYSFSDPSRDDDEVKLLEVTKKETKPLAVIDLLSDEELENPEFLGSDDEIQVVKICNGASTKRKLNPRESKSRNYYDCKKEERCSPVSVSKLPNFSVQVHFPDCFQKDVVCVARPPLNLLPHNVCPAKEAYILDFKPRLDSSQPQRRVWNSYREMQVYQRIRRQNRGADQSFRNPELNRWGDSFSQRDVRQNFNQRRTDSFENRESNPWADIFGPRDVRQNYNHRRADPPENPETSTWMNTVPHRGVRQNLNQRRTNSSEEFSSHVNTESSPWLGGNYEFPPNQWRSKFESPADRERGSLNLNRRQTDSPEMLPSSYNNFSNSDSNTYPLNSSRNFHPDSSQYPVPNAAAEINSVVSFSNQDMNVSMVDNHILQPPLHSSSRVPSFNANLPNLAAMGPVDIMAEVHRTAYSVATNMLSSIFGRNANSDGMPILMPFDTFPLPPNSHPLSAVPPFNTAFNAQSYNREQYSTQNNRRFQREPYRRQHNSAPFPCVFRNLVNRRSWIEVKEAVGGQDKDSFADVGSDVEEVPINPIDILWDSKNICPLLKPGFKYPISDILKTLQVTRMANLLDKSHSNEKCFPTTCTLEISFDVYLPGTKYKKTCPDIPKHRIIVVRSTDPIPRYSELAFLQKRWNDGATLQVAVVDNGDISFHSFNSISLPVIIPHEK